MKTTQPATRLTALAVAMAAALCSGNTLAEPVKIHAGGTGNADNFTMLDDGGGVTGGTNDVVVTWDGTVFTSSSDYAGPGSTANMTASTVTPFFNHAWVAHSIQVFAPGTYSFDTALGGGNPEAGTLNVTVPKDKLGIHMLFDWNSNNNIDVFIVVQANTVFGPGISYSSQATTFGANLCGDGTVKNCLWNGPGWLNADGGNAPAGDLQWSLASIDGNADTIMGVPMTPGGPFAGFSANFNFRNLIPGGLAPLTQADTVTAINPGGVIQISILNNDLDIDNGNGGLISTAQLQGGTSGILISNETGGMATKNANGTVTWTNTTNTTGTDSFTYQLRDIQGNLSEPVTVTIPVGVGEPPVANDDALTTAEDTDLVIDIAADLIANDSDAETATGALTLDDFTQPDVGGTLIDQGTSLLFTPDAGFKGTSTFTYTIIDTDSNRSNPATVTIDVVAGANRDPVAQDNSATGTLDTPISNINVLINDSDPDGDTLTVTDVGTPSNGMAVINDDGTITYTPNEGFSGSDSFTYGISDGRGGAATATVNITIIGGGGGNGGGDSTSYSGTTTPNTRTSPAITGGSNFTMLDGQGADVGGTNDISVSWDGTLRTSTDDTSPNMLLASDGPTPFFGFTWVAHDVRVFGPGSYTFEACPGNDGSTRCSTPTPLAMTVGPTQVGMHMLFDWGQPGASTPCGLANCNIDVVQVVELNRAFAGANDGSNNFGAAGAVFTMASTDGNGDGIAGISMVDGAFVGFNANFNLNLTPQFALPVVTAVASQGGNPTSVIVPTGGPVTVTATAPAGATFDWESTLLGQQTDAALVAVNSNGTTSQTFVFDPSTLPDGPVAARVTIRDPNKGNLANHAVVPMLVSATTTLADAADADNNGIPDGQDFGLPASQLPSQAGNGTTYLIQSSAGALRLGPMAAAASAGSGSFAAGLTAADIGVVDDGVESSCVGGCFDFEVTGLANGASIDVVLPLSEAIPAEATARKFANGEWRDYSLLGGDAVASAPGGPGTCPEPGNPAYEEGLNEGHFCIQLTITDGGRNDADGTANGRIQDPFGVGGASAAGGSEVVNIGDPPLGGGCTMSGATNASQRLDLWLLASVLGWLGLRRKRQS